MRIALIAVYVVIDTVLQKAVFKTWILRLK